MRKPRALGLYAENDEEVIQALVEAHKGNEHVCTLSRSRCKKGSNNDI